MATEVGRPEAPVINLRLLPVLRDLVADCVSLSTQGDSPVPPVEAATEVLGRDKSSVLAALALLELASVGKIDLTRIVRDEATQPIAELTQEAIAAETLEPTIDPKG